MDITLALGGGGAKGNSHIGVLRGLEKEGFQIRAIAGTSFGGLVGVMYAAGFSPDEIENIFAKVDQTRLYGRSSEDKPSLLGVAGVRKWLNEVLGDRTFIDLEIPCAVVAVDIDHGREIVLNEGPLKEALLATIALPGIFPAQSWRGTDLVDGGVLNPIPVSVARKLKPDLPVVAVVLHAVTEEHPSALSVPIPDGVPKSILDRLANNRYAQAFEIFMRSIDIGNRATADLRLAVDKPEVVIRPDVANIRLLDRVDVHEVAKRGEQGVKAALLELNQMRSWTNRLRRRVLRGGR